MGVIDLKSPIFERHKEALLENFDALVEMIEKIDATLLDLDTYMDALQPQGESGRLRVLFGNSHGERVPELRSMYRARSETGWHSRRVTKGWGTRSLKRSGPFEQNYEAVKALCAAAEALIAERSKLMVRLRSMSAGFRESVKNAVRRIDTIDRQHVEPFRQILEPERPADDS